MRIIIWSVQFSSGAQLYLTLCDSMDCSTLGFPVHHQLPKLAQTHVHRVNDAIQPVVRFSSCLQSSISWYCLLFPCNFLIEMILIYHIMKYSFTIFYFEFYSVFTTKMLVSNHNHIVVPVYQIYIPSSPLTILFLYICFFLCEFCLFI